MRWGGLRCVAASRRAASSPVGCLAALLGPPRASAGRRSSRRGSGRWVGWRSNADRRSRRIASPPARLDGVPLRTFASRLQKYILVPWSAGTVRAEGFAVPSVCATGPPCRLRRHFSSLPAGKDQRLGATPGDEPVGAEKAFALARQSRLIPIVATQSISSLRAVLGQSEAWRTLLQTLRTQIASTLCGQVARIV